MSPATTSPTPQLYKYQIGKETTWGTPVTPTAQLGLVQELEFSPEIEAENAKEHRGSFADYVAQLLYMTGTASLKGQATFEDIAYWLDAVMGEATPSGAGPYTRDYIGALGTLPTRRVFTLVKGQSTPLSHAYGLSGAIATKLNFNIGTKKPLMYAVDFVGKSYATSSLAALSDRTQTPILPQHFALYIDAVGGTMGTTAISTTWFDWDFTIDTKAEVHPGLGSLTPVGWHEANDSWEVKSKLSLELDATSKAILDAAIGTSLVQKQIRVTATSGTNVARFDMGGSMLSIPKITTDKDGVVSLEFEFTGVYNTALGNYLAARSVNSVSALP